ncbi:uncharacterized protein DS421_16g549680 [Arachis hypogaea]|nr:uncharacterized protein DS421_16g549680 [Arachis hypogaea]
MLIKLKNVYMNFMLRLAGNIGSLNTQNNVVFGGKRIPKLLNFLCIFLVMLLRQGLYMKFSRPWLLLMN